MDDQSKNELIVFQKFVNKFPGSILPTSIQKRRPPEPDIYCQFADGREQFFELTECVNPKFAQSVSGNHDLRTRLESELDQYRFSSEFKDKFQNKLILIYFFEGVTKKKKIASIQKIFEFLISLDVSKKVDINIIPPEDSALKKTVSEFNICSVSGRGPALFPGTDFHPVDAFGDLLRAIERKKDTTYNTDSEIDILVYYISTVGHMTDSLRERFSQHISKIWRSMPFERMWLYSYLDDEILFHWPPTTNQAN